VVSAGCFVFETFDRGGWSCVDVRVPFDVDSKPIFFELIASFLCKQAFPVMGALIVNPIAKLWVWRIPRRHIAATVVFLLVSL